MRRIRWARLNRNVASDELLSYSIRASGFPLARPRTAAVAEPPFASRLQRHGRIDARGTSGI